MRKGSVVVAFVAGLALLYYAFVNGGDKNWTPLRIAYPHRNVPVSGTFWIAEGGRFELEVRQPATKEQRQQLHPDVPPLHAGTLAVRVIGHGTTRDSQIEKFENGGSTVDENIFSSRTLFTLPSRGTYSFSMLREGYADLFLEQAPAMTLERVADPVSLGLGYALAKFLGFALLAGVAIAAIHSYRSA